MRVEIRKSGVLRCVRADGSVTWQKQSERHAAFFAMHDLTHFAVESVLGYRNGFYGLIAQGWEIEDTTGKGSRGKLPDEAVEVERIVGAMDLVKTAGEFNESLGLSLTEAQVGAIRAMREDLFRRWGETPETLVLEF